MASGVPAGWEFLHSLPEKHRTEEECQLIIATMDHASKADVHMSTMCMNISSLVKISDKMMGDAVPRAVGRLLMQLNIPEHFLNPATDKKLKTMAEQQLEKLEKMILPHSNSPGIV